MRQHPHQTAAFQAQKYLLILVGWDLGFFFLKKNISVVLRWQLGLNMTQCQSRLDSSCHTVCLTSRRDWFCYLSSSA